MAAGEGVGAHLVRSEDRVEARVRERQLQDQSGEVGARDEPDRREGLPAAAQRPSPGEQGGEHGHDRQRVGRVHRDVDDAIGEPAVQRKQPVERGRVQAPQRGDRVGAREHRPEGEEARRRREQR